ncbi:plant G-box-binding factor protein [Dioscorea alata]|uniref:Plant G-box-binding factor protein n=2 Tax=Dioscorea alata TaxID=55571 RepID=A0ACB7U8L8_DIOAL|nr:plant G-box-binding factor protein [Dioscorea alata]KAH7656610.1 plant G-box-binding factor protein [Dioscorea alata]
MGNEDVDTPTENPKSSSAQDQPPAGSPVAVYPDWATFQAYYNTAGNATVPPPGFFHSSVASSPQGHPFMWSPQMIPPYGTPPFVAMYPPGAIYPHPSVATGSHPYGPYAMPFPNGTNEPSVPVTSGADADAKSNEGKGRSPLKRSKGSLGSLNVLTGKQNAVPKASGASGNGPQSQSGESGSEGSTEGSYATSKNGSQHNEDEHGSGDGEAQNGFKQATSAPSVFNQAMPFIAIPPSAITGPTTTLNIGMDYMGGPVTPVPTIRGKATPAPPPANMHPSTNAGSRDVSQPDLWLQDERELKRERRKQSNRESARRSRLRKQAECEELAQRVVTIKEENDALRQELDRLREMCGKLSSENASLTEQIQELHAKKSNGDEPSKGREAGNSETANRVN